VATLPLLAQFLDEPYEPGPYSPASRLFWNEFYLDLSQVPELRHCPEAQRLMESAEFRKEVSALRAEPLVEYRRQMALKRRVLEALSRTFWTGSGERRGGLDAYRKAHPELDDYARFRAVCERLRQPWPAWPGRQRDGDIREGDYDEEARRYHLYVQWVAREQVKRLSERAQANGPGLYLDFPLGVNPDSYDIWRERDVFARTMAGGAPPDSYYPKGQNWGFPPQNPVRMREQGYRYLRACLRHHMEFAGVLRIDHLMGLHRLFWIPQGMDAKEGVYVGYSSSELYAVFSLESHRYRTALVGEDLGTVPPEVPPAMQRHRVARMYVVQYEIRPDPEKAINPVYKDAVASVNTHDMAPFAAFWKGLDIDERVALGILEPSAAEQEHKNRQQMIRALVEYLRRAGSIPQGAEGTELQALHGCLEFMASSDGKVTLVNLEDLWGETEPQNVPGTWRERPNWRRRAKHSIEELNSLPGARELLARLTELVRKR
jgi:4-alpha-glucanotransferase